MQCNVMIIVSKMTRHCEGTAQMSEESGSRTREKRCDFRRQQKMEREGAAVTCDRRLFHRQMATTGNVMLPMVDS